MKEEFEEQFVEKNIIKLRRYNHVRERDKKNGFIVNTINKYNIYILYSYTVCAQNHRNTVTADLKQCLNALIRQSTYTVFFFLIFV